VTLLGCNEAVWQRCGVIAVDGTVLGVADGPVGLSGGAEVETADDGAETDGEGVWLLAGGVDVAGNALVGTACPDPDDPHAASSALKAAAARTHCPARIGRPLVMMRPSRTRYLANEQ